MAYGTTESKPARNAAAEPETRPCRREVRPVAVGEVRPPHHSAAPMTINASLRVQAIALACLAASLTATPAHSQPIVIPEQWGELEPGRHAVGFRLDGSYDRSRRVAPPTDFEGKPSSGPTSLAMQVGIWYPATVSRSARPMQYGMLAAIGTKRNNLSPVTQADRNASIGNMRGFAGFAFGREIPESAMRAIDTLSTASVLDAPASSGRFPVVLAATDGSIASASLLFEYLASHGMVVMVVASPMSYATQQVARPGLVVEARVRDYEYLLARAYELPFVDTTRIALFGGNFDAMAALAFQMKNMAARAVVSLDGWEGKQTGVATVRSSLHYNPRRMRVPYLTIQQDEPEPQGGLVLTRAVFDSPLYSDRQWLRFDRMTHAYLIGNPLVYPHLPVEKRRAYELLVRSVERFLTSALGDSPRSMTTLATAEGGSDGRSPLLKDAVRSEARPAVPYDAELEQLIMVDRAVDKVAAILRQARQTDSSFVLFPQGTMALYAFRFSRMNDKAFTLRLLALNAEAYPRSWSAADALGDGHREMGDTTNAIASYQRAVTLLGQIPIRGDTSAANEVAQARQGIEAKIAGLRR